MCNWERRERKENISKNQEDKFCPFSFHSFPYKHTLKEKAGFFLSRATRESIRLGETGNRRKDDVTFACKQLGKGWGELKKVFPPVKLQAATGMYL